MSQTALKQAILLPAILALGTFYAPAAYAQNTSGPNPASPQAAVQDAEHQGLVTGPFQGDQPTTLGQYLGWVVNTLVPPNSRPSPSPGGDGSAPVAPMLSAANQLGLPVPTNAQAITGYVTREDAAVIIVTAAGSVSALPGGAYRRPSMAPLDELDITPADREAAEIAVENGFVSLRDGYFRPKQFVTQTEAAQMVMTLHLLIEQRSIL